MSEDLNRTILDNLNSLHKFAGRAENSLSKLDKMYDVTTELRLDILDTKKDVNRVAEKIVDLEKRYTNSHTTHHEGIAQLKHDLEDLTKRVEENEKKLMK